MYTLTLIPRNPLAAHVSRTFMETSRYPVSSLSRIPFPKAALPHDVANVPAPSPASQLHRICPCSEDPLPWRVDVGRETRKDLARTFLGESLNSGVSAPGEGFG